MAQLIAPKIVATRKTSTHVWVAVKNTNSESVGVSYYFNDNRESGTATISELEPNDIFWATQEIGDDTEFKLVVAFTPLGSSTSTINGITINENISNITMLEEIIAPQFSYNFDSNTGNLRIYIYNWNTIPVRCTYYFNGAITTSKSVKINAASNGAPGETDVTEQCTSNSFTTRAKFLISSSNSTSAGMESAWYEQTWNKTPLIKPVINLNYVEDIEKLQIHIVNNNTGKVFCYYAFDEEIETITEINGGGYSFAFEKDVSNVKNTLIKAKFKPYEDTSEYGDSDYTSITWTKPEPTPLPELLKPEIVIRRDDDWQGANAMVYIKITNPNNQKVGLLYHFGDYNVTDGGEIEANGVIKITERISKTTTDDYFEFHANFTSLNYDEYEDSQETTYVKTKISGVLTREQLALPYTTLSTYGDKLNLYIQNRNTERVQYIAERNGAPIEETRNGYLSPSADITISYDISALPESEVFRVHFEPTETSLCLKSDESSITWTKPIPEIEKKPIFYVYENNGYVYYEVTNENTFDVNCEHIIYIWDNDTETWEEIQNTIIIPASKVKHKIHSELIVKSNTLYTYVKGYFEKEGYIQTDEVVSPLYAEPLSKPDRLFLNYNFNNNNFELGVSSLNKLDRDLKLSYKFNSNNWDDLNWTKGARDETYSFSGSETVGEVRVICKFEDNFVAPDGVSFERPVSEEESVVWKLDEIIPNPLNTPIIAFDTNDISKVTVDFGNEAIYGGNFAINASIKGINKITGQEHTYNTGYIQYSSKIFDFSNIISPDTQALGVQVQVNIPSGYNITRESAYAEAFIGKIFQGSPINEFIYDEKTDTLKIRIQNNQTKLGISYKCNIINNSGEGKIEKEYIISEGVESIDSENIQLNGWKDIKVESWFCFNSDNYKEESPKTESNILIPINPLTYSSYSFNSEEKNIELVADYTLESTQGEIELIWAEENSETENSVTKKETISNGQNTFVFNLEELDNFNKDIDVTVKTTLSYENLLYKTSDYSFTLNYYDIDGDNNPGNVGDDTNTTYREVFVSSIFQGVVHKSIISLEKELEKILPTTRDHDHNQDNTLVITNNLENLPALSKEPIIFTWDGKTGLTSNKSSLGYKHDALITPLVFNGFPAEGQQGSATVYFVSNNEIICRVFTNIETPLKIWIPKEVTDKNIENWYVGISFTNKSEQTAVSNPIPFTLNNNFLNYKELGEVDIVIDTSAPLYDAIGYTLNATSYDENGNAIYSLIETFEASGQSYNLSFAGEEINSLLQWTNRNSTLLDDHLDNQSIHISSTERELLNTLPNKADKTALEEEINRATQAEEALQNNISTKANKTDLTVLENRVNTVESTKANKSDLTSLSSVVNTKANQTDLTALENRVESAEEFIEGFDDAVLNPISEHTQQIKDLQNVNNTQNTKIKDLEEEDKAIRGSINSLRGDFEDSELTLENRISADEKRIGTNEDNIATLREEVNGFDTKVYNQIKLVYDRIDTESDANAAKDALLEQTINTEVTNREAAIQQEVNDRNTAIANLKTEVEKNAADLESKLDKKISDEDTKLENKITNTETTLTSLINTKVAELNAADAQNTNLINQVDEKVINLQNDTSIVRNNSTTEGVTTFVMKIVFLSSEEEYETLEIKEAGTLYLIREEEE